MVGIIITSIFASLAPALVLSRSIIGPSVALTEAHNNSSDLSILSGNTTIQAPLLHDVLLSHTTIWDLFSNLPKFKGLAEDQMLKAYKQTSNVPQLYSVTTAGFFSSDQSKVKLQKFDLGFYYTWYGSYNPLTKQPKRKPSPGEDRLWRLEIFVRSQFDGAGIDRRNFYAAIRKTSFDRFPNIRYLTWNDETVPIGLPQISKIIRDADHPTTTADTALLVPDPRTELQAKPYWVIHPNTSHSVYVDMQQRAVVNAKAYYIGLTQNVGGLFSFSIGVDGVRWALR